MNSTPLTAREAGVQSTPKQYVIGILAAVVTLFLCKLLTPLVGNQILYLSLWPAVAFSVWYCGVGPAIVTVLVGATGIWFGFFNHPFHSAWSGHLGSEYTNLVGFLIACAIIISIGETNLRTRLRDQQLTSEARAATAKFKALFEQTTVFAGVMDTDGIVIDANRLSLDMCGYKAEEVLGKLFSETPWWRGSAEVQEQIRFATRQAMQGETYREVLPYFWADGSQHLVDFALHPIRDDDGKIIFLHPTGVDITDLKKVEEKYRQLTQTLQELVQNHTEELEHRTRQLRELSRRLMQLQDSERRRIARELHDSAGQLLAALGLNMQAMLMETQSLTPDLIRNAEENYALTQQLSQSIRTMSYLLHPPLLDEVGLPAALDWYVRGLKERSGLDISLSLPEDFGRLPADLELAVFRIVQECLTNIHRHSAAKSASIRLSRDGATLRLEVADDGKGIPADKLEEIQTLGSGVGFQGIRERFSPYNGTMHVDSSSAGTAVTITLRIPGASGASSAQSRAQSANN